MAQQAKKICSHPGCGTLTYNTRCIKHSKAKYARQPDRRGSAASRGYDNQWRKLRNSFIMHNPLCRHCEESGRVTPAQDVDHRKPFKGKDDPLRLDWNNLQSLCRQCHNIKTRRESAPHNQSI